jgi:hypothetical protein
MTKNIKKEGSHSIKKEGLVMGHGSDDLPNK